MIDISGDGTLAAAAGTSQETEEHVVALVDLPTRSVRREYVVGGPVRSIDVADDGRYVLVGGQEKVTIIDVAAGRLTTSSFQPPREGSVGPATIKARPF